MFNTFVISLKISNTYKVNRIITILKNTIIGDKFSDNLYTSKKMQIIRKSN